MQQTPEQIEARIAALPQELQNAIASVDQAEKIQRIGKAHGLQLDEVDELFAMIGEVMLGATHPKDLEVGMKSAFGLSSEKAHAIALDVDEELFTPIREALKTIAHTEEVAPTKEPENVVEPIKEPIQSTNAAPSESLIFGTPRRNLPQTVVTAVPIPEVVVKTPPPTQTKKEEVSINEPVIPTTPASSLQSAVETLMSVPASTIPPRSTTLITPTKTVTPAEKPKFFTATATGIPKNIPSQPLITETPVTPEPTQETSRPTPQQEPTTTRIPSVVTMPKNADDAKKQIDPYREPIA